MPSSGGANVLLVEDSADDVLFTRRALRKAGIHVPLHVCADGDEGIRHLADELRPSLVLLDWKLPRRSGVEVLEWMRKNSALREVPVIVVSSSRQQEDLDAAVLAGANAFLEKPLQFHELLQQLERFGLAAVLTGRHP